MSANRLDDSSISPKRDEAPLFQNVLVQNEAQAFGACDHCPTLIYAAISAAAFRGLVRTTHQKIEEARARISLGEASDSDEWFVREAPAEIAAIDATAESIMHAAALYRRRCQAPGVVHRILNGQIAENIYQCSSTAEVVSPDADDSINA